MFSKTVRFTLFFVVFFAAVAGIYSRRGTLTPEEVNAYKEISFLYRRGDYERVQEKCDGFLRNYPGSKGVESVCIMKGGAMEQLGKYKEVGAFYRELESRYPKSEEMERFIFFQGYAFFQDANFKDSALMFERFLKNYGNSPIAESAQYYLAMSHFLNNEYKNTLASCRDYLVKFPNGRFSGDLQYRLSYIDFNDKEVDQADKIIRDLGDFLKKYPDDLSNGSMLCLMGDTYRKKKEKAKTDEEGKKYEDLALQCFDKVIGLENRPDDVIQYALDNSTTILQGRKDWSAIAELHGKFLKTKPDSPLALISATWVAKAFARDGRAAEAAKLIVTALKSRIGDPSCEQVEPLIDELVKAIVPRKKAQDIDSEALDKKLVDLLNKTLGDHKNATTEARVLYARARLAQMLKRVDLSDFYMKGITTTNAKDPSVLSAVLLAVSGDILLKSGDLDGAEKMFRRLSDRYKESMYSDAGPCGLGYVALGRKKPEEALRIFESILENNADKPRLKEATLGMLQALVELDKLKPATDLAHGMVGNKMFRGETAAKAYMQLGLIFRKQAVTAVGEEARLFLTKAHEVYQRVYVAYQGFPEICAEAYWQAYLVLKELKDDVQAQETLKALAKHPKLKDTARAKQAREMLKGSLWSIVPGFPAIRSAAPALDVGISSGHIKCTPCRSSIIC